MELTRERRPVSRETRLLLMTIVVSLAALWVLARIRFAERPVTPNPITPVLTQLAPPPVFEQLSAAVFQVQSRLAPLLMGINMRGPGSVIAQRVDVHSALRLDSDIAIALIDPASSTNIDTGPDVEMIATDPASGLVVLRVPTASPPIEPFAAPPTWSPRRPESPRFLVAGEMSTGSISVRPVFVGNLEAIASPVWAETVWVMPARTDLGAGTFVFTIDGAFAGLAVSVGDRLALVPGDVVKNTAARLRLEGQRDYGRLGIEARPLTPDLASTTGVSVGVVVTWVDPKGPAAGQVDVTDVIVAISGEPLSTYAQWWARVARLTVGEPIVLGIRQGNEVQTVTLTARPVSTLGRAQPPLGLIMRTIPRVGVEVVGVAPASVASLAGIEPGDVITMIGDRHAPTPADVTRVVASASDQRSVLVAVTRGPSHHVLVLKTS